MISMLAGVGSGSSMYGKTRYVETRSQSSRLGRGGMTTGAMLTAQDIQVPSQGDLKNDTNGKSPGGRQNKEDEDHAVVPPQPSVMEDRRKQEGPYWNEHGTHSFIYIYSLGPYGMKYGVRQEWAFYLRQGYCVMVKIVSIQ